MPPTQLPPAQPTYILRGHSSSIHRTTFIRGNTRLVTGDAEGWIVVWDLVSKRAAAVWKAHEGIILGVGEWTDIVGGEKRLITHGKDNLLLVWKFSESDEVGLSTVLPVDVPAEPRRKPWLLYSLEVNTMNFCSFASCIDLGSSGVQTTEKYGGLLVAIPNILTSETVDVFQLPTNKRIFTIPNDPDVKTGMIMALSIFYHPISRDLTVIVGYESGQTMVSQLVKDEWKISYLSRCHDQPILSLDVDPESKEWYLTSSADAVIGKHPIPDHYSSPIKERNEISIPTIPARNLSQLSTMFDLSTKTKDTSHISPPEREMQTTPIKIIQTKHSGQQSLRIRSDGKIFATAGWDSKVRVYSTKTLNEIAVLKWHGVGCFAVDFADVGVEDEAEEEIAQSLEEGGGKELVVINKSRDVTRDIKKERLKKVKLTHWVAAGSKDGKVSLWDIY